MSRRVGADGWVRWFRGGVLGREGAGAAIVGVPLLASLLLAGCGGGGRDGGAEPPRPDLLLISLDTLRADAVGAVDAEGRSLTPALDALAADGVRLDAFAPMAFTLPSHMSMLTGVYPEVHGVAEKETALPAGIGTMAELVSAAGYVAHGVVTSRWLEPQYGFGRGFARYRKLPLGVTFGGRVNERALSFVDAERAGAPLFLFAHYYDAHSDFSTKEGGTRLPYWAPPERLADLAVADDEFCDADGHCATRYLQEADRQGRELPSAELDRLRELYRRGVGHLDERLGDLFEALEERRLYRDALIIVTSDHGEEFREHGRLLHTQTYDETVAVPLIVKPPRGARSLTAALERVSGPVSLVDLLPTVLDFLELEPPGYLQGRSLLSSPDLSDVAVLAQDHDLRNRYALRTAGWKLIVDYETGARELYDLAADGAELRDLVTAGGDPGGELERRLDELLDRSRRLGERVAAGGATSAPLSPEAEAELEALGYLN